jgi:hypothetical protein
MDELKEQYKAQITALQAELERTQNRLGKAQVLITEIYEKMLEYKVQNLDNEIVDGSLQSDEEFFNIQKV